MTHNPDDETHTRSLRTRSLGVAAADALGVSIAGVPIGAMAAWTDEEWAAHDAKVAAAKAADQAQLEQAERERRPRQLLAAGWPKLAVEIAARADTTQKAIAYIAAWKAPGIFVLLGPKGCGKTVAAAWWALQRREPTTFVRSSSFAATSRYDREDRDALLRAHALVLDDLGTEYVDTKGSFLVDLDELVDTFYGDRRPLIITTNAKPHEIIERFGERIADRLREVATIMAVGDNAPSLRGQS